MKLDATPMIAQMQSMTRSATLGSAQEAIKADALASSNVNLGGAEVKNSAGKDFGQLLSDALNHVNSLQSETGQLRTRFDMGDKNVNLSDVMIAAQKSSIAFDATIEVRNKVVDAYKQIMAMPI